MKLHAEPPNCSVADLIGSHAITDFGDTRSSPRDFQTAHDSIQLPVWVPNLHRAGSASSCADISASRANLGNAQERCCHLDDCDVEREHRNGCQTESARRLEKAPQDSSLRPDGMQPGSLNGLRTRECMTLRGQCQGFLDCSAAKPGLRSWRYNFKLFL